MKDTTLTGYASIDKPWLKFYDKETINTPIPNQTIYEHLYDNNKDYLNGIAIEYFGKKITYKKLFDNIDEVAIAFDSLGVKKGDIVTLALPNIPENVYCMYALNRIGAIFNMVDLRSKGDALIHYYNETKSKVVVICDLFAQNTFEILNQTQIESVIIASPFDSLPMPMRGLLKLKNNLKGKPKKALLWNKFIKASNRQIDFIDNKADDAICILHTSGTTGTSKGVVLTNKNFLAMVNQVRNSGLKYSRGDVFLNQVPPFLAYNVLAAVNNPLSMGLHVTMLPDYKPDDFSKNIYKYQPNHVIAGPADWSSFLNDTKVSNRDYSFLKTMISGSDKLDEKVKNEINELLHTVGCNENILEGYGLTEVGAAAIMNLPQRNIAGSVGVPLKNVNICIYDNESKQELKYDEVGEICMHGPTVMKEYFGLPHETANVIKMHEDGLEWLHTGDFGYIDSDGNIYLEGRLKRIIVRYDGIKVSPFAIEDVIMKHSNIVSCCVVGAFDNMHQRGYIPIAYVVFKDKNINSLSEIQHMCNRELSENYLPQEFILLDELPITSNGKVDYRTLEDLSSRK